MYCPAVCCLMKFPELDSWRQLSLLTLTLTSLVLSDVLLQDPHMLVPVRPVLLVVEAEAVEDLVSDVLLLHTARGCEVDHLLPALLAHVGPAARGYVAVPEVSVDGEPQKERLW